jgi:hypothetical protein
VKSIGDLECIRVTVLSGFRVDAAAISADNLDTGMRL